MGGRKKKYIKNKFNVNEDQKHFHQPNEPNRSHGSNIVLGKETNLSVSKNKAHHPGIKEDQLNLCDKVEFERYGANSERVTGREHYVHSLCQLCKEDLSERIPCPKCLLITYCSNSHRRQHWPIHADLCAAIVDVCKDRRANHIMQGSSNLTAEKFRIFRFQNMVECETKVERPLEGWEKEMFIFPNVCAKCYEYKTEDLVVCLNCHHSCFCEGHKMNNHSQWCQHLMKYKNIVRDQSKFGILCPSIPNCKTSLVLPKLLDIRHFFNGVLNDIDEFEFFELTELVTYPLTALNALLTINKGQSINRDKITLHVVGAEAEFETNKLEKWEYYILHLIPGLQNLEIEFVGPELNVSSGSYKMCNNCLALKKTVTFKFHNKLYHTLFEEPNISKPSLICVFNPGLYRMTGFDDKDTWSPSIASIFTKNSPVLITAYTYKEILLDVERVKSTQNISVLIHPTLNTFSSLKPSLNFVSDEESPIIFKNQYYCIMTA